MGTVILTAISTLGGYELLKFIVNSIRGRKSYASNEHKTIYNDNLSIFKDSIEFLKAEVLAIKASNKEKDDLIDLMSVEIKTLKDKVEELEGVKSKLIPTTCYNLDCLNRLRKVDLDNKEEINKE